MYYVRTWTCDVVCDNQKDFTNTQILNSKTPHYFEERFNTKRQVHEKGRENWQSRQEENSHDILLELFQA